MRLGLEIRGTNEGGNDDGGPRPWKGNYARTGERKVHCLFTGHWRNHMGPVVLYRGMCRLIALSWQSSRCPLTKRTCTL
jgi:hypothetical protein